MLKEFTGVAEHRMLTWHFILPIVLVGFLRLNDWNYVVCLEKWYISVQL